MDVVGCAVGEGEDVGGVGVGDSVGVGEGVGVGEELLGSG